MKEGDWSDPNNWSTDYDIPEWLCYRYPKLGNSKANFNNNTKARIHVTENATVDYIYLARYKNLDLTFWGETNRTLSCNKWYVDNAADKRDGTDWQNKITLDNVTFEARYTDNDINWWYWPSGFHWTMVNGGKLYRNNGGGDTDNRRVRMHNQTTDGKWKGRFDILNGGTMQFDSCLYVGGDCLFVVSNGTLECGNSIYLNSKTAGGTIRICGTNSNVRIKYNARNNAESGYQPTAPLSGGFEFLLPDGPLARVPVMQYNGSSDDQQFGSSDATTLAKPLAFKILPESPATRVDATNDYHLVQWMRRVNHKKLDVSLPHPDADELLVRQDVFKEPWTPLADWTAAGLGLATNLGVRICGASKRGIVSVTGSPETIDLPELSPALGEHGGYVSNDVVTCTAPEGLRQVSESKRVTVTGWILKTVDPVTLERTPVATNDAENAASCTFTHLGGWHEVEWRWRVEYRVQATSDNAGVTVEPAEQWIERGGWATVSAANSATKAWYKWLDVEGGAVSNSVTWGNHLDNPLRFSVANPIAVQACSATRYYLTTNGSDSAAGTTWATALKTVRKALEKANATTPAHVTMRAGQYPMSTGANQEFALDKPIVFEGEDDDCSAIIYRAHDGGNGAADDYRRRRTRSVIALAHADAQIRKIGVTTKNTAWGRGVTCENGGLVDGCHVYQCYTVENNGWGCYGGGVVIYSGGHVRNSVIERNVCNGTGTQDYRGGGIWMNAGLVEGCVITNNWLNPRGSGYGVGGGVYMEGTGATLRNCIVARNVHTSSGTGVRLASRNGLMENCIVAENTCERFSGRSGVSALNGVIRNCVIWGNTSLGSPIDVAFDAGGGWEVEHSVSSTAMPGEGNLVKDPLFIPGDPLYRSPYGVLTDLGATTDRMRGGDAFDFGGNPRVSGAAVDLGPHEIRQDVFACDFTAVSSGSGSNAVVTLDGSVVGTSSSCRYTWRWRGADSTAWQTTNGVGLAHLELTGLAAGKYSIQLTVQTTTGGATTSAERAEALTIAPMLVYVSNKGSDAYPYDTPAKATPNLQAAIDAVADFGEVRLVDGAYPHVNKPQLVINRPIRVVSENGPEKTIVYGYVNRYHNWGTSQESPDKFIWVGHTNALVAGITFCGYNNLETLAVTELFGGMFVSGGVASNCVIRNWYTCENPNRNSVSEYGAGVHLSGGLLVDSTVCCNQIKAGNGNGYPGGGIYMSGGTVDRCVVSNNWTQQTSNGYAQNGGGVYMDGGTLKNSLIVGNTCNNYGGGVFATAGESSETKVYNCTIVGNTARYAGGLRVNHANVTVMDTIVRGNFAYEDSTAGSPNWRLASGSKVYNLWSPQFGGYFENVAKETLARDPEFAGPAVGDYSIDASSPCVDTAVRVPDEGERDLNGNPRVSGARMDAGCCENALDTPTFGLTYKLLDADVGTTRVRFEAHGTKTLPIEPKKCCWLVDPEGGVDAVNVSWFEDDFEETNSVVTLDAGWHSVAVCVYYVDEAGIDRKLVMRRPNWFAIYAADLYVSADNLSPQQPYGSWETAASSIDDVWSLATDGSTIHLAAGTYVVSGELSITKAIKIVGPGGDYASGAVLDGIYKYRPLGVYHKDAVVSGVTIARGVGYGRYRQVESGFGFYLYDGTITNCWIYDNCMHNSYGTTGGFYGMGGRVHNGTLVDCVITNNWVYYGNEPHGFGVYVSGTGLVDRCVFTGNRQTANHNNNWLLGGGGLFMDGNGRVRNCIFRDNRANRYGGAWISNGTIDNCLFENNHAFCYNGTAYAGGLYVSDPGRARNCVLLGNTSAKATGAAIDCQGSNEKVFRNCLLSTSYGVNPVASGTAGYEDEELPALWAGHFGQATYAGQWGADEALLKWRMDWGKRVPRKAPVVNKGETLEWMDAGALDFNRRPRVNGGRPEIGPFECHVPLGFFYMLR
ncbi:MAG: right-handed parallel beta-helix repeat-containing protein [Kiritimatiellae bacterium]|nr:right-handed parallel beta-helix repeat-containing protein [Kiritimatiellia bacterium]